MWVNRDLYVKLVRDSNTKEWLARQVVELEERVKDLQTRLDQERQRSDEAVDQMLRVKGLPAVSPTEKPPTLEQLTSLFDEDPAEVREITHEIKERSAESVLLESK